MTRFYEHGGVTTLAYVRAALQLARAARNRVQVPSLCNWLGIFSSPKEKTTLRQVQRTLFTFKIEHHLSKDQILELYNQSDYLGQRAFGFAGCRTNLLRQTVKRDYSSRGGNARWLAQRPLALHPIANLPRAKLVSSMFYGACNELSFINDEQLQLAQQQHISTNSGNQNFGK